MVALSSTHLTVFDLRSAREYSERQNRKKKDLPSKDRKSERLEARVHSSLYCFLLKATTAISVAAINAGNTRTDENSGTVTGSEMVIAWSPAMFTDSCPESILYFAVTV